MAIASAGAPASSRDAGAVDGDDVDAGQADRVQRTSGGAAHPRPAGEPAPDGVRQLVGQVRGRGVWVDEAAPRRAAVMKAFRGHRWPPRAGL